MKFAHERSGQGTPTVLVHGLGGTSNVWQPQISALETVGSVLRVDLDGAGRSPARGKLSIDSWVDLLIELMDAFELKSARFAGHSLGTLIVQHLASKHPRRVSALALLGVNRAPEEARRQTVRARAAKARTEGMVGIADSVIATALSPTTVRDKPVVVAFVRELLMRQDAEGYARSCEAVSEAVAADLSRIACPVLAIAGKDDAVSPPDASVRIASELPNARSVVIEQCGHWMTLEQPTAVNAALVEFFTSVP